jgi:hypothetical protein
MIAQEQGTFAIYSLQAQLWPMTTYRYIQVKVFISATTLCSEGKNDFWK